MFNLISKREVFWYYRPYVIWRRPSFPTMEAAGGQRLGLFNFHSSTQHSKLSVKDCWIHEGNFAFPLASTSGMPSSSHTISYPRPSLFNISNIDLSFISSLVLEWLVYIINEIQNLTSPFAVICDHSSTR